MKIELGGHSGCKIEVVHDANETFVRKTSPGRDYNLRLRNQYLKQRSLKFPAVNVTSIYNSGYSDGFFYFDMEFVNGSTLAKHLQTVAISEIGELIDKLTSHMVFDAPFDKSAKSIFDNKVDSVMESIYRSLDEVLVENLNLKRLLDESNQILRGYSWDFVPNTLCHGDYTLENILITKNHELYVIDLLDSFYDSWQIDFAKLLQDVELGWSFRFESMSENLTIRAIIFRQCLFNKLNHYPYSKEMMVSIYHVLLLNILRIVPYTHDDVTMQHLIHNIEYLIEKIKWLVSL